MHRGPIQQQLLLPSDLMHATLHRRPFRDAGWIFEDKLDSFRAFVARYGCATTARPTNERRLDHYRRLFGERAKQPMPRRGELDRSSLPAPRVYLVPRPATRAFGPSVTRTTLRRGSVATRCPCTGNVTANEGPRQDFMGGNGGGGRNRTGVDGFAGRCMTTLPPRQGKRP
jgi:hypothetical protein